LEARPADSHRGPGKRSWVGDPGRPRRRPQPFCRNGRAGRHGRRFLPWGWL